MNLLARMWFRLSLIVVIPTFNSCVDPVDVGVELDPDGIKIDVLYEEFWLPSTNILIDSVRTNQTNLLLAGRYEDPIFGTTTSTAYTQITTIGPFAISNDTTPPLNKYIFDSLILDLRVNFYHSNGIGQPQEIFIHQLEDTLFGNVFYLKEFTTPISTNPIAQKTINYSPVRDTLLTFVIANEFGEELLDILERTSTNGNIDVLAILNGIRGFGIRGGDNNTALIGFDPNHEDTKMRMYYQIENERDSLFMDLQLNTAIRYNSTVTDRSTSVLNSAVTHLADFDVGDGNLYLQPGSGVFPKVDLTPLTDFLINQDNVVINNAQIKLSVTEGTENQEYIDLNQNLRYVFIEDNENIDVIGVNSANRANSLILSNAAYLSGFSEQLTSELDTMNYTFTGDITLFSQLINTGDLEASNLALMPTNNTTFNQTILNKDSIRVEVFYTVPK